MEIFRFRRRAEVKSRKVRPAPLLAGGGLSGSARRVNGVVATFALFGAFGAVALAVALTPGAQQSASLANASQTSLATAELVTKPVVIEKVSVPAPMAVEQPKSEAAAKSDRLAASVRAPARTERSPDTGVLRSPLREEIRDDEIAAASEMPEARGFDAEPEPQAELEPERAGPPAPGAAVGGAGEDTGDEMMELAVEQAVEEMVDEAVDEAAIDEAPEEQAVATQLASVRTDVNLRARPSNSAAVILVVPGSSDIEVIGCDYWCEVIYRGQRGWIYKGFVRRAKS